MGTEGEWVGKTDESPVQAEVTGPRYKLQGKHVIMPSRILPPTVTPLFLSSLKLAPLLYSFIQSQVHIVTNTLTHTHTHLLHQAISNSDSLSFVCLPLCSFLSFCLYLCHCYHIFSLLFPSYPFLPILFLSPCLCLCTVRMQLDPVGCAVPSGQRRLLMILQFMGTHKETHRKLCGQRHPDIISSDCLEAAQKPCIHGNCK